MSSATGLRPDPQSQKRDISPWVLIFITVIISAITAVASYSGRAATQDTKIEEHSQQIKALQDNTITKREADQLREEIKVLRGDLSTVNTNLLKVIEKRR